MLFDVCFFSRKGSFMNQKYLNKEIEKYGILTRKKEKSKHLSYEARLTLCQCIKDGKTLAEIAKEIGCCRVTIYNELKQRRKMISDGKISDDEKDSCKTCLNFEKCKKRRLCGKYDHCRNLCKYCGLNSCKNCYEYVRFKCKRLKFPFICPNNCTFRRHCPYSVYDYDPKYADYVYRKKLVETRKGVNLTEEEAKQFGEIVKNGLENKQSPEHILKTNNELNFSLKTMYNYIGNNVFPNVSNINLPFGCYKKRKMRIPAKYEYNENKNIDRSGRMYSDYLEFSIKTTNKMNLTVQMDFLGATRDSKQEILVLVWKELFFVYLYPRNRNGESSITEFFDDIEKEVGLENFRKLFPCILTDRDIRFSDFTSIERSCTCPGEERTKVFFCDPKISVQKANVENMNRQLRSYFEKKVNINDFTKVQLMDVANNYNSRELNVVGGKPAEKFIFIYGENLFKKLGFSIIKSKSIKLKK